MVHGPVSISLNPLGKVSVLNGKPVGGVSGHGIKPSYSSPCLTDKTVTAFREPTENNVLDYKKTFV